MYVIPPDKKKTILHGQHTWNMQFIQQVSYGVMWEGFLFGEVSYS